MGNTSSPASPASSAESGSGIDPLVLRALRLLDRDTRRAQAAAGSPWAAPVRLLARLGRSVGLGRTSVAGAAASFGAAEVDRLADRLMRESDVHLGGLDVGVWGWSMYRDAARAALRLHAIALSGDDALA
jgi:hypothetical protein